MKNTKQRGAKIIPMPQTVNSGSVDIKLEPSFPSLKGIHPDDLDDAIITESILFVLSGQADARTVATTLDFLQRLRYENRPTGLSARLVRAIPLSLSISAFLVLLDIAVGCIQLLVSGASADFAPGLLARLSMFIIPTPSGDVSPLAFIVVVLAALVIMTIITAFPVAYIIKRQEKKTYKVIKMTIDEVRKIYSPRSKNKKA